MALLGMRSRVGGGEGDWAFVDGWKECKNIIGGACEEHQRKIFYHCHVYLAFKKI